MSANLLRSLPELFISYFDVEKTHADFTQVLLILNDLIKPCIGNSYNLRRVGYYWTFLYLGVKIATAWPTVYSKILVDEPSAFRRNSLYFNPLAGCSYGTHKFSAHYFSIKSRDAAVPRLYSAVVNLKMSSSKEG